MRFIKYICAASLLAAAACALWSCSDEDDRRLSDAVLASAASLTFEAQDGAGKIITVYADADWVTEIPDWVTVSPAQGTGVTDVTITVDANLRDGAVDTPRKATLVFKGRTLASRAEVLIAQNGDKYRDVKECAVGELPALADETVVSVPAAVVVAVTTKGFVVSDERMTDNVFVADAAKVAVGDKVSIKGTKSSDAQKLPTVTDCDQVKVLSSGGAVAYPTPDDLSAAIDSYTSDRRGYVAVTGFYDGSTVAVAETSKYSVSVVDAPAALGLAALAGHNVTVTGYYAGLAEPVHRIMATAVEDEGAVEMIYFSDDFEWMDAWSVASNAGRTVETDDLKAECPRVTTNAALKAPFLTDLEENHGYKLIYGNNDKKGPNTPDGIYLQRNYFKFGKTGYQAGIVLPPIDGIPAGERLILSFDWCPMRQGADKGDAIDPVNLIVVVANGGQETTFEVPEAGWEAGHKLEWIRAEVALGDILVDKDTKITVKQTQWAVSTAHRWFFDNVKIIKAP